MIVETREYVSDDVLADVPVSSVRMRMGHCLWSFLKAI